MRPIVGRAKKHAYFELRDGGFAGRLWGTGANVVPITERRHQLNVFSYIAGHKAKGAWVWTFREGFIGHRKAVMAENRQFVRFATQPPATAVAGRFAQ